MPYFPTATEVAALGLDPGSRPGEFDCRKVLTPPGVVYTVTSGTGMTGRMFSRECIQEHEDYRRALLQHLAAR